MRSLDPPPIRRLPLSGDEPVKVVNGAPNFVGAQRRSASASLAVDRMQVEGLSVAYGPKLAVDDVSMRFVTPGGRWFESALTVFW